MPFETQFKIELNKILYYITANCYDPGHGLLGPPTSAIDVEHFMDKLVELTGMTKREMGDRYDAIRCEVQLLDNRYQELKTFHEKAWGIQVSCRRAATDLSDCRAKLKDIQEKLDLLADELRLARDRAKAESDAF